MDSSKQGPWVCRVFLYLLVWVFLFYYVAMLSCLSLHSKHNAHGRWAIYYWWFKKTRQQTTKETVSGLRFCRASPLTTIALGECISAFSSFKSLSAWVKREKTQKCFKTMTMTPVTKHPRRSEVHFSGSTLSHSPSTTWLRNLVADGCSSLQPDSCIRRSTVWLLKSTRKTVSHQKRASFLIHWLPPGRFSPWEMIDKHKVKMNVI